jgi:hypothetical protein
MFRCMLGTKYSLLHPLDTHHKQVDYIKFINLDFQKPPFLDDIVMMIEY